MKRMVGLLCVLAIGCEGSISEREPGEYCESIRPGDSPVRRLTRFEYNNSVRDLLGDTTNPADDFPPEEEALGFNNQAANLGVTALLAEQYMVTAEAVSARATADLSSVLPCDPTGAEQACAREFIETMGLRAWRRPLTTEEADRIYGVFEWGMTNHDFQTGIQLALQAMLQSPHFLYRVEFGTEIDGEDDAVRVDDWEMASRLSYMLWGTMPDDILFAAAEAGELSTPEQIAGQAERMLADPHAHESVRDFYSQWLQLRFVDTLEKDGEIYPGFYPALRPLLRAETEAFMDYVIWEADGDIETILTADFSFMNAELAAFYGVEGPAGEGFERVQLDPSQRAGFLTQAGVLATHAKNNQSSPIHRGKFVREQLFCQMLPAPPDDIPIVPPDLDPDLTTRERFSQHSTDPACSGCHSLMDPIGFGFENYDGTGMWRDEENGTPVDASGELFATDIDGPFDGAVELAHMLAGSEEVHNCVVTQYFRYGYGRAEKQEDICTMAKLSGDFGASGHNMRDLIVALTQTDAFLYRKPTIPE
jgi:hypothetical protein